MTCYDCDQDSYYTADIINLFFDMPSSVYLFPISTSHCLIPACLGARRPVFEISSMPNRWVFNPNGVWLLGYLSRFTC